MEALESYFYHDRGLSLYRKPGGFVAYKVQGEEFFMEEFYVVPEKRKTRTAYDLFFGAVELAKELGCQFISGFVDTEDKGPIEVTELLKLYFKVGFYVTGVRNGNIIIAKRLTEG